MGAAAEVELKGFIEEKGIKSRQRPEVEKAADVSAEFHRDGGETLNVGKAGGCSAWATRIKDQRPDRPIRMTDDRLGDSGEGQPCL